MVTIGSLARACCAAAAVIGVAVTAAGCGSEEPATPGPEAPASYAPQEQDSGVTAQVGGLVDVITAHIPQPAAGAADAQLEMTLAVTTPGVPAALTAVSSPAAASAVLLVRGHAAASIAIPASSGGNLRIGPPSPDEVLLRGVRGRLTMGKTVAVTLTFGKSASATLRVPVTAAP
jgi:copper(I)-binding protein